MSPIGRVLTFAPRDDGNGTRDKDIFDIIWLALAFLPVPVKGRIGIKQAKRVRSGFKEIAERLNADSEENEITLSEQGGDVVLSDEDFRWVTKEVESVQWKGGNVDAVSDTFAFLDGATKVTNRAVIEAAKAGKDGRVLRITRPTEPVPKVAAEG